MIKKCLLCNSETEKLFIETNILSVCEKCSALIVISVINNRVKEQHFQAKSMSKPMKAAEPPKPSDEKKLSDVTDKISKKTETVIQEELPLGQIVETKKRKCENGRVAKNARKDSSTKYIGVTCNKNGRYRATFQYAKSIKTGGLVKFSKSCDNITYAIATRIGWEVEHRGRENVSYPELLEKYGY